MLLIWVHAVVVQLTSTHVVHALWQHAHPQPQVVEKPRTRLEVVSRHLTTEPGGWVWRRQKAGGDRGLRRPQHL